ncbi:hypothetical protein GIB67_015928 [Kingdonia uniflora]|uniref:Salicylic acid binding protein 2 n=1 Tax=Kingdonia uniflora TaxID=39325 RepID=A0A7J7PCI4_9MAGN|nr:hypothetical protein GIB67_015928 [Kingdonia uniflora]
MKMESTKQHFVLVHGACHGAAWCWYKVQTLLESEGHRVTALDLAASGTGMRNMEDVDGDDVDKAGITISKRFIKHNNVFDKGYGFVNRFYVVCMENQGITEDIQRWMIENYPVKEVKGIEGVDHMPMFSKPQELCRCLIEIGNK